MKTGTLVGLALGGVALVGGAIGAGMYFTRPKTIQQTLDTGAPPRGSAAAAVQNVTPTVPQAQPDWAAGVSQVLGLASQAGGIFAQFSKSMGL